MYWDIAYMYDDYFILLCYLSFYAEVDVSTLQDNSFKFEQSVIRLPDSVDSFKAQLRTNLFAKDYPI